MKYANTKIRILSPEHSEAFQKAVFAEGGEWRAYGQKAAHVLEAYLFVTEHGTLQFSSSDDMFNTSKAKEVIFDMNTFNFPNDLKDFMVVEHKNGGKGVIAGNSILYDDGFNRLDDTVRFDESLPWSITKVYEKADYLVKLSNLISNHGELLWDRNNTKEIQEKISSIEEKQRQLADELKELQNQL
ncbi:MAG: hypothetical protein R3230_00005 [Nitrosopumilaceae archaeon]|nr:hypothetical protein [Nitrosopumilaceae archaeon]